RLAVRVSGGTGGVAGDVGLDPARVHAGDAHGVPGQQHLLAQALGAAPHGELGSVVRALPGHRQQPEQAGDVHDVPVAGCDQVREEGLGAVHHAPEVDVHDALDVLEGAAEHVAREGDARVVVDLVDVPELGDDRLGVGQYGGPVGHVEGIGPVPVAHQAGGLGEAVGVDVG